MDVLAVALTGLQDPAQPVEQHLVTPLRRHRGAVELGARGRGELVQRGRRPDQPLRCRALAGERGLTLVLGDQGRGGDLRQIVRRAVLAQRPDQRGKRRLAERVAGLGEAEPDAGRQPREDLGPGAVRLGPATAGRNPFGASSPVPRAAPPPSTARRGTVAAPRAAAIPTSVPAGALMMTPAFPVLYAKPPPNYPKYVNLNLRGGQEPSVTVDAGNRRVASTDEGRCRDGRASAAVSSSRACTECALTTASQNGHAAAMPPASGR